MRNKWYVIGIAIPALLLGWWAINLALGEGGMMALVPGALAVALLVAAVRVARAASFAPAAASRWDTSRTTSLSGWLDHRTEVDGAARDARDAAATKAARRPENK